jgi:UDP-3-O-[3-hydroxymyristoyl] glucosamine N-acyltransferase
MTSAEICQFLNGTLEGRSDIVLHGLNRIEAAGQHEVSFLSDRRYARFLDSTAAGCLLIGEELEIQSAPARAYIRLENPYRAFMQLARAFYPEDRPAPGLRHPSAAIDPSAEIDASAAIGANVVIAAGCRIGPNSILHANVSLYTNVEIGSDSVIHANVVCREGTYIGARCIINPGAVLGAEGFGFVEHSDGSFEKVPQVGTVRIEDDVEIGANTTIDRATLGVTHIKSGVKIDNLVQIAHNVEIGENSGIVSQTGISGSTKLGKRNRIGGQVGVVGHITTADDVYIEAQSGVAKAIEAKGKYFGSPAIDHREHVRQVMALKHLPDLLRKVRALEQEVAKLRESQSSTESPSGAKPQDK